MTSVPPPAHRDLAWAVRQAARRVGEQSPTVRGSDWRQAIVQTVNADGTVTTVDGIVARRMHTYLAPAAGDVIVVTVSSAGDWLAAGRMASGDGAWTAFTLAGTWTPNVNYYTPSYRVNGDGTASLCGLASMSGALTAGMVVATLPTAARPAKSVRVTVQVAVGYFGVMTIAPNGDITLNDFNPTPPSTGGKYVQFDTFSRYRLA
ncbi:hypothetical protein OG411_30095 [Streptomyces pseudogriseolus]|uniref:hypothetical protein n=1 Tax=Streptomyces pseudogriseolus TaxID=36817 RepID=UPI00324528FE